MSRTRNQLKPIVAAVLSAGLALFGAPGEAAAQDQIHVSVDFGGGNTVDRSKAYLQKATFWGCGSSVVEVTVNSVVDLKAGHSIDEPNSIYCQVKLTFLTDILTDGSDSNSDDFTTLSTERTFSTTIYSQETIGFDLLDTTLLEGIYGGTPELEIARD